jgi:hypothetical protein
MERIEFLSSTAGQVLLGSVEPESFQNLAFEQGPDCVDSGPIPRPLDQVLLRTMREAVA